MTTRYKKAERGELDTLLLYIKPDICENLKLLALANTTTVDATVVELLEKHIAEQGPLLDLIRSGQSDAVKQLQDENYRRPDFADPSASPS